MAANKDVYPNFCRTWVCLFDAGEETLVSRLCLRLWQSFLVTVQTTTELYLESLLPCLYLSVPRHVVRSWCALTLLFNLVGGSDLLRRLPFDVGAAKNSFIPIREAVCAVKAAFQRLSCLSCGGDQWGIESLGAKVDFEAPHVAVVVFFNVTL